MKKHNTVITTISLMVLVVSSGCIYNFPSSILNPPDNPLTEKLKTLEIGLGEENIYRSASVKSTTVVTNYATVFSRTLERNIFEQSRNKWGYCDLSIVFSNTKGDPLINAPLIALYIFPGMFLPPLFGAPLMSKKEMEVEISIYDSQRELIKKYIINDNISGWTAYPISPQFQESHDSYRLLSVKLFHQIMREFEKQVSSDIGYINAELEKAGLINKWNASG